MFDDAPFLDGKYSIWGQVTEGMKYVDMIKRGSAQNNGSVTDPDKIIRMKIAADGQ
jgi:peptidylprolyl isomerase